MDRPIVEAIHSDQVREHGGAFGLRDKGLLESSLSRPRQKWSYDSGCDLAMLAAAYAFAITRNHPFVDGNKRTALVTMYVFLGLNGFELEAPEPEAVVTISSVAAGSIDEEELAGWVRSRLRPWRD